MAGGYTITPLSGAQPSPAPVSTGGYSVDVLSSGESNIPGTVASLPAQFIPADDPSKLPSAFAQAGASLPTDQNAKIKFLASSLFPDRTQADALSRMGVHNGRIFYVDSSNKPYYAEPAFSPLSAPLQTLRSIPNLTAGAVGPGITTAVGLAGSALTPELAGGVPGAVAGGAVGDIARQGLATVITGEQKSLQDRLLQTGGAALEQGVGQLGGHIAGAYGSHLFLNARNMNPLGATVSEAAGMTPGRAAEAEYWTNLAQQYGIHVTPGEAANSAGLLNVQRQLLRNPESSTLMQSFLDNRNQNLLPESWRKNLLDNISSDQAPAVGGQSFAQGAQKSIDYAVQQRRVLDQANYGAIMRPDNVLPDLTQKALFSSNPAYATALREVRGSKYLGPTLQGAPDNSLPVWDAVKQQLDQTAKETNAQGLPTLDSKIANSALQNLLPQLDQAFPGYAAARAAHAGATPDVQALTQGITGIVAKAGQKSTGLQDIPSIMFGEKSNPISITQARNAYIAAGQESEWNAGVRAHLDGIMTDAQKTASPGASLWKQVGANKPIVANLRAALTPQNYQALDDLMNIAEMIKRAPGEGAATATDIGRRADFASGASKLAGTAVGNINPLKLLDSVSAKIKDASAGKGLSQMVNMITSDPRAVMALRSLRNMTPGQMAWTRAAGYLGTVMIENGVMNPVAPEQQPSMVKP